MSVLIEVPARQMSGVVLSSPANDLTRNGVGKNKEKPSPKLPDYAVVDGLYVPGKFSPDNVRAAMNYKPRPDDVIIATYPKCGTTWTQYIVSLIFRKGRPFEDAMDFFRSTPFFEMWGQGFVDNMVRPGAIKIHLPISHTKHWSNEAKYIYIARNPKDCLVSLFHHTKMFCVYDYQDGTFDEFFELFMNGKVEDNDYLDHLLGWYEKRNEPNVLFLTFENMKADTKKAVMDIAEFLGPQYAQALRDDPKYLEDVMRYSSFEYMKDHTNDIWGYFLDPNFVLEDLEKLCQSGPPKTKASFCRKGVIGDWKGHLTPEQAQRLDLKFKMMAKGSDILKLWESRV